MTPEPKSKCNCNEMSCQKDCNKRHTHKGFFCEVCEPVEATTQETKGMVVYRHCEENDGHWKCAGEGELGKCECSCHTPKTEKKSECGCSEVEFCGEHAAEELLKLSPTPKDGEEWYCGECGNTDPFMNCHTPKTEEWEKEFYDTSEEVKSFIREKISQAKKEECKQNAWYAKLYWEGKVEKAHAEGFEEGKKQKGSSWREGYERGLAEGRKDEERTFNFARKLGRLDERRQVEEWTGDWLGYCRTYLNRYGITKESEVLSIAGNLEQVVKKMIAEEREKMKTEHNCEQCKKDREKERDFYKHTSQK